MKPSKTEKKNIPAIKQKQPQWCTKKTKDDAERYPKT